MPDEAGSHELLNRIIAAVLSAADPSQALTRSWRPAGPIVASLAVGKAAPAMDAALARLAPDVPRLVIAPEGTFARDARAAVLYGDHPVPTRRNVEAARAAVRFVESAKGRADGKGALVFLLSGGASALLTLPVPELSLESIQAATSALLRAGASIEELNTVRKHCEQLKGGGLARLAYPMRIEAYILSDVVGDRLDIIGSGPVTPDPSTPRDAIAVLERYKLTDRVPAIADFLKARAGQPPPPAPHAHVATSIIGNNGLAIAAAADAARSVGYPCASSSSGITGDAAAAGRSLAAAALTHAAPAPASIIRGGETTVDVAYASGIGGRNQELALAAAIEIDGRPDIAIAAFATDGVDGPTNAAGAIVSGRTCPLARGLGMDPKTFLADHDSHTFFKRLDEAGHPHLIRTGPTGVNINDIAVALVG